MPGAFYITTPIYYVNDVPHLGHAYTTIAADALARYHRMRGDDVRFLTGTDEHGQKIERAAAEKGVTPQQFVDQVSETFRSLPAVLACEPNDFIRTTEARHKKVVHELWEKCRANGFISEGTYAGLYCVGCEAYYTEKELEAKDGAFFCPIHKTKVEKVEEPSFFFDLDKLEGQLLELYEKNPKFIQPESRRNEVISFVKGGLQKLSLSRTSFKWGISVPGADKHVVYVWFDALTNYLSALENAADRAKYWPESVHLIGKDILRFHAIYWPAFLMAAGIPVPKQVFAHGWLNVNGHKMSKSLRNTVEPKKLVEVFTADVVRFYLLREVAFGLDGDFSHEQLFARYKADLADNLGNLLNRSLGLCAKLRPASGGGTLTAVDGPLETKLADVARSSLATVIGAWDEIAPHKALEAALALGRAGNKYIDEAAPWNEGKKGEEGRVRVDTILATALETLRWIATMLWPVMPSVSDRIHEQLGLAKLAPTPSGKSGADLWQLIWSPSWDAAKLPVGTPIFPKIEPDRQAAILKELGVDAALAEANAATPAAAASPDGTKGAPAPKKSKEIAPPAAEITYEEFSRLDLRIGLVVSGERVPKSDKLLKLMVDLGESSPRQIVAGIGKSFAPEALVGQQVVVVANLKPAKLMGLESRGMIFAASGEAGESDLALLMPGKPRAPGTRVK